MPCTFNLEISFISYKTTLQINNYSFSSDTSPSNNPKSKLFNQLKIDSQDKTYIIHQHGTKFEAQCWVDRVMIASMQKELF